MIEFKKFPASTPDGQPASITVASGPVIIEDGKVLLDQHDDIDMWKFPGGRIHDTESLQETAKREVKAELGIEITITSEPFVVCFQRDNEYVVLVHYLATRQGDITPGRDVTSWNWHDIDHLPEGCAPNIKQAVEHFRQQ
jgi:8-oxo-dGTP diphosphatase